MEIKKEDHLSVDVGSQNQGEFFTNRVQLKSNSRRVLSENDDVTVKSEAPFLDFYSQNESENLSRHLLNEIRPETIKCSNICEIDIKIESGSEKEREFLAQNCTILKVENYNSDHHIDSKIEIKEEPCWPLETETSSLCDDDIRDEDFTPVKSPRCNRAGETRITSDLFSNEDFGNYTTFSMTNDSPECKRAIQCQSQRTDVIHISSIGKSICLETPDDGKIVSMACFCKQNNLLQEGNTSKLDIDKKSYKSALSNAYKTPYKCDICQNNSTYSFHLKNHKLVKNIKEVNKYAVPEKGFAQLRNLKRHKLILEGIKPHKCNTCNKAFTDLSTLKTHTLIHEGIKPHKCSICNKAFTQLQQLKSHKLIHEGIKPHACNICNKAFTDLSGLKKHKLIHEGIKPHNCNICNKSFTHLSNLKRHKLIHEGIKPHKCDICNKAFTDLSTLKRHTLIHGDIKPHECEICNRSFTDLSTLKRHKVIHQDIKPHNCDICNKAFSRLHLLKRHKLIHEEKKTTVM